MASKKDILNNLREYTSDQIAEAIKNGTVTMYELSKSGNLTPMMRKRVEAKLANDANAPAQANATDAIASVETSKNKETTAHDTANSSSELVHEGDYSELVIPMANIDDEEIVAPIMNTTESTVESNATATSQTDSIDNKGMFNRPFSFEGRIRRTEYGVSMIIAGIVNAIMQGILGSATTSDAAAGLAIFYIVFLVPYLWFIWAQGAKRCHDRGNSGWYQIIPFYGLWMLFGDGEQGNNEYGNNPKE